MDLSPTQRRIMNLLSDGLPHTLTELRTCLSDMATGNEALLAYVSNLRKIIRPLGYGILSTPGRKDRETTYQLVRTLAQADE